MAGYGKSRHRCRPSGAGEGILPAGKRNRKSSIEGIAGSGGVDGIDFTSRNPPAAARRRWPRSIHALPT